MPRLDIFTFTTQAFWTLMGFFLLYVIVAKLVLPRLGFLMNVRKRLHFRMLPETYSNIENAAKVNKIVKTLSKNRCKKMLTLIFGTMILLCFVTILFDMAPVAIAEELIRFSREQRMELEWITNQIIATMSNSSYLLEGTSLLRALRGNCFETVQSIVIHSYPPLHECVMAHIHAGTVFDPISFLESNPIPTTGRLEHISSENALKICNTYNAVLTDQAKIISIFENGGVPEPHLVKKFLTNSSYLDYLLKHVKSPIWEQVEIAKQKLGSSTTIWPPKSKF